jgi:hypothetical protein
VACKERAQPVTVVAERLAQNPSNFHETSGGRVCGGVRIRRARHTVCALIVWAVLDPARGRRGVQGIVKPLNTHVTPAVIPMLGSRDVIPKINPASARTVDRV